MREPASPLFGTLEKTNQAIELRNHPGIFRDRPGKPCSPGPHVESDARLPDPRRAVPVKAIVAGENFSHASTAAWWVSPTSGSTTTGWGIMLSQANLYGFGTPRLESQGLSARAISDEWTRLTFGNDPKVDETIDRLQLDFLARFRELQAPDRSACRRSPTSPAIITALRWKSRPNTTVGDSGIAQIDQGVGMDRTVATGTGYIPANIVSRPSRGLYESLAACPGRSAAVHAPRSLHLPAARRQNRNPVHLRFSLRRRSGGGRIRCATGSRSARPDRRPALSRTCWSSLNIRPGRRRSLARWGGLLVS